MGAGGIFADRGAAVARGAGARLGGALIASVAVHAAFAAAWIAFRETPPVPLGTVAVEIVAATAALGDGEPPGRPETGRAAPLSPRAPVPRPVPKAAEARAAETGAAETGAAAPAPRAAPPMPRAKPIPTPPRSLALQAAAKIDRPVPQIAMPAGVSRIEPDMSVRPVPASVDPSAIGPLDADPQTAATTDAPSNAARESSASTGARRGAGGAGATQPGFSPGTAANPLPRYPLAARRRGLEGRVLLRVEIDVSGRPTAVAVLQGSGHGILDRAAARAVRDWRFQPASRAGRPVAGTVEVPILFRLTG